MAITDLITLLVNVFAQLGYPGIFVLMVMESATLPVPSEVVLPLGGFLVYQRKLVDYGIGYYLGRPAVLRYGRIVRFSHERLETTERWFSQHGTSIVLLARFVPLLRTLIAFPAGIVRMEPKRFLAYSAVGILVWDIALVYIGFLAGQNSAQISSILQSYFLPLGLASIVIVAIVAYRSFRKRPD